MTHALMNSAGARSGSSYQGGGGGGSGGGGWSGGYKSGKRRCTSGVTVKARGLPYSTSEYDLVDFFADYGVSSGELLTAAKLHIHISKIQKCIYMYESTYTYMSMLGLVIIVQLLYLFASK